ncbi:DUF5672 family protein [Novosphingobium sp. BW1]|uniref:DUF5672 family protein n=1 Tax=Novosphingobium sp. BW1 TaxID=2592621 RepID=UPI0011DE5A0F|nr:DUF5672 family protein [Novosphingobium sp. BW1]TYC93274.1 hypothetical protein FMM79_01490 [Novosphingobium sp. BW1]
MPPAPATMLALPQVTLCAVSSVNVAATIRALELSMAQITFGEVLLFTDVDVPVLFPEADPAIRVVPIARLTSSAAYSAFLLERLAEYVTTSHCLVTQWDGHVIDARRWRPEFLKYDYVGASWPQFGDGHDVGNGGFSLRSRALLEACRSPDFNAHHPEDVAIGRTNRARLEERGLRFAPRGQADAFAAERAGDPADSFGYHGVFLMPEVLGLEDFWQVYRSLDERSSLRPDFRDLLYATSRGHRPLLRALHMIWMRGRDAVAKRTLRKSG